MKNPRAYNSRRITSASSAKLSTVTHKKVIIFLAKLVRSTIHKNTIQIIVDNFLIQPHTAVACYRNYATSNLLCKVFEIAHNCQQQIYQYLFRAFYTSAPFSNSIYYFYCRVWLILCFSKYTSAKLTSNRFANSIK